MAVLLLAFVAPARADLPRAPDALPQIWGVEVDGALVRDLDSRLARRLEAAGVTLLAPRDGLTDADRERLQAIARRWNLDVFQPLMVHDATDARWTDAATSDCARVKRERIGSRCGVRTDSVVGAAAMARAAAADVLVVRSSSAREFARLDAAGATRMVGILRLAGRSYRPARWRAPIRAAQRSNRLDLVVQPTGPGRRQALERYVARLARVAPGDRIPPSDPTNLKATAVSPTSVELTWRRSSDNKGVAAYGLYLDGASIGSTTRRSTRIGSLGCGPHLFEVDAVDRAGNRSAKSFVTGKAADCAGPPPPPPLPDPVPGPQPPPPCVVGCPDTTAPSQPSDTRATGATQTSVSLAWGASSDNVGVTGYRVFRDGSEVAAPSGTAATVASLACGTSYLFGVEARDAAANVSTRGTVRASTSACPPPPPPPPTAADTEPPSVPPNQRYTSVAKTSVTLAWDAASDNTGVAGYHLYLDGQRVASKPQLSHTYSGLTCGKSYTFALEAYDAAGNVSDRAYATGSRTTEACDAPPPPPPDTQAPSAPSNQRFSNVTRTSVEFAWDAASDDRGVAGYRLYRNGEAAGTTQSLSRTFSGLACGTSSTFAVEAYDAAGNVSARVQGTRSTEQCEQPPPDPPPTDPPPASGLGHLWVDQNGGSCTRSATPVAYQDAAACGSASQAYNVANGTAAGSTILIRGGTYPNFRLNGSRSSSNRIVLDAAPGEKPVFTGGYLSLGDGQVATAGPDYVTLKNLTTAEFGAGAANPDNRYGIFVGQGSSFIRLENMRAGNFLIQASQNIEVIGGEYGPCRAADRHQQCEINKVDHYPGAPQPKNILIDGVHFHDYDLGPTCFKPSDGGTSTGNPDCHWRSMYLNGVHDLTLRNSRFRESFIAPWMTVSGPDAARTGNRNILVENNVFGTGVNYGNPGRYTNRGFGRWEAFDFAWCQNASSGVMGYEDITFRFNSSSRAVGLFVMFSEVGCQSKVRNVRSYGNIGFRNGCDPIVEYRYNVYSNSGTCHSTDRNANAGGGLPFYASDTHSPGPNDYALTGAAAAPDNLVPASMGCPATDRNGTARGQNGFCDAGAYER